MADVTSASRRWPRRACCWTGKELSPHHRGNVFSVQANSSGEVTFCVTKIRVKTQGGNDLGKRCLRDDQRLSDSPTNDEFRATFSAYQRSGYARTKFSGDERWRRVSAEWIRPSPPCFLFPCDVVFLGGEIEKKEEKICMRKLNTSRGNENGGSGKFTSGQGYVERLEDGLGHPSCRVRYRKRCVASGRCENCGAAMPSGDGRFRCPECLRKQADRKHRARVLRLWTLGASDEQVARLCIGETDTPRLPRGWKAAPLAIRCGECRETVDVLRSYQRCACGGDLWQGVPPSVRKRWLWMSDGERAREAIG